MMHMSSCFTTAKIAAWVSMNVSDNIKKVMNWNDTEMECNQPS